GTSLPMCTVDHARSIITSGSQIKVGRQKLDMEEAGGTSRLAAADRFTGGGEVEPVPCPRHGHIEGADLLLQALLPILQGHAMGEPTLIQPGHEDRLCLTAFEGMHGAYPYGIATVGDGLFAENLLQGAHITLLGDEVTQPDDILTCVFIGHGEPLLQTDALQHGVEGDGGLVLGTELDQTCVEADELSQRACLPVGEARRALPCQPLHRPWAGDGESGVQAARCGPLAPAWWGSDSAEQSS